MIEKVPLTELRHRLDRFRAEMDRQDAEWKMVVIFGKINLYFFTGTMQEGMLIIPRDDEATLWVRRSYERAVDESYFPKIKPMESYRDAAQAYGTMPDKVHMELEVVPIAYLKRFQKYFPIQDVRSADKAISKVRAIKTPYELKLMEKAGAIHQHVLEECVPGLFREGMTELELAMELYALMVDKGHHGVVRFSMFDTEMGIGHIAFGESSIYPTYFNGPGGAYGQSPAVPILGSRDRRLKKGELVFIDVGLGVEGYHTDKTMTYMFGGPLPQTVLDAHERCVDIQDRIAAMLEPGSIPSQIYRTIMESLEPEFLENFMGFGRRRVKFLGHGIGLHIDEYPVIAQGFDEPLEEGMVLALEPKKGIAGVGMVGIENTFLVTPQGGRCITGASRGMIPVY
jgi:Xaa-Pro aminopeptidase